MDESPKPEPKLAENTAEAALLVPPMTDATQTPAVEVAAPVSEAEAPAAQAVATTQPAPGDAANPQPAVKPRFSWPFRVVLGVFLFDMVARSLITLTPFDDDWLKALEMVKAPLRLPTAAQLSKIEAGKDDKYKSTSQRYWAVADSVLKFASPWPSPKTQAQLLAPSDWAKYGVVWVGTRLSFMGAVLGLDQDWPMFSPNVRRVQVLPRAKLIYADGTRQQLWLLGEPYDLTRYHRWFIKRPLQIDLRLHQDYDARMGVSRHIANKYPVSDSGAPLQFIELYEVKYVLPKPGQNARAILAKQSAKPTPDEPVWRYDVARDKGKTLKKDEKKDEKKTKATADSGAKVQAGGSSAALATAASSTAAAPPAAALGADPGSADSALQATGAVPWPADPAPGDLAPDSAEQPPADGVDPETQHAAEPAAPASEPALEGAGEGEQEVAP